VTPATVTPAGINVAWIVNAIAPAGTSSWSLPVWFNYVTAAPFAPTQISPIGAITTATPTFTWNAVATATSYSLYRYDTGITTTYTATAAGCAAGTGTCSVTPATVTPAGINVAWIVNAIAPAGTSSWSLPVWFDVQ
ncbi:MAG: hypothetical protein J0653_01770, partial [Deltaproteobacteria bacterium]|nr:hypothetical protein [Deltaproteobacteria bacterium]